MRVFVRISPPVTGGTRPVELKTCKLVAELERYWWTGADEALTDRNNMILSR